MYDFACEHCDGTVRTRVVEREALRHKGNFVILEDVPIGVCDKCGSRYFDASVLRRDRENRSRKRRSNGRSKYRWIDMLPPSHNGTGRLLQDSVGIADSGHDLQRAASTVNRVPPGCASAVIAALLELSSPSNPLGT